MKLVKYDGTKTYMFPNCTIADPESVTDQFPAWKTFTHVITTDDNEQVLYSFQNLAALRMQHNVPADLTEDEAIAHIEDIINNPPAREPEPTAEERIAAALEYQNLVNM